MRILFALFLIASASAAQADSYRCDGTAPDWLLEIDRSLARFVFPALTEMEVKLITPAEGQDWPRAYSLIGERDTAIVLLEQESCGNALPFRAHVMTQRGQTPILLTGCCTALQ